MALVHLPSLFCPLLDIYAKDAALLRALTPSRKTLVIGTTIFHICYEAWLALNGYMCGGAIPYPWYYDIFLKLPYPMPGLAAYLVVVNALLAAVVLALRRLIVWRAGVGTTAGAAAGVAEPRRSPRLAKTKKAA